LTEAGDPTDKYFAIRDVIGQVCFFNDFMISYFQLDIWNFFIKLRLFIIFAAFIPREDVIDI